MVRFIDSGGVSGQAQQPAEGLAPVTPLFGERHPARSVPAPTAPESTEPAGSAPYAITRLDRVEDEDPPDDAYDDDDDGYDACGEIEREIAERNLLRKLRGRSLSVVEARAVIAERSLDAAAIDAVLAGFLRRGYLDDAALAEQLVHAGVDRKGQGRRVIAQTLAKRGIPRDVADAALAELPDDDAERALEFARSRARSMGSLDRDTALRRLAGQLARRGYGGSVALDAAKRALDEPDSTSGVRFR